jgi:two-component sensor histidine kinase
MQIIRQKHYSLLKTYLFIVFVFLAENVSAQQVFKKGDIVELKKNLRNSIDPQSKIKARLMIGSYYLKLRHGQDANDMDSASVYFNAAVTGSKSLGRPALTLTIEALSMLGEVEFARNNAYGGFDWFNQALDYLRDGSDQHRKALIMARAVKKNFSYTQNRVGAKIYIDNAMSIFKGECNFKAACEMAYYDTYFNINGDRKNVKSLARGYISEYSKYQAPAVGRLYYLLAKLERYDANLNLALQYVIQGIDWMNKNYDDERQDLYYGELGLIYQELGQTEKSIRAYKKTLYLRDTIYLKQEYLIRTVGFVTEGLIKLKKNKEALSQILAYEAKHVPDGKHEAAFIAQIKANCYKALGKYALAEKYYLFAEKNYNVPGNEMAYIARQDLGRFYTETGNYSKGAPYLKTALYPGIPASRKKEIFYLLHKIDSASGNYASALKNYKIFNQLNDSIFNVNKIREAEKLQVLYETKQREQDIRILKQQKTIQNGSLKRAEFIRNATIIGLCLLAVILVIVYMSYRKSLTSGREIGRKNNELNDLVTEKQWLIKEIHHRVKNNLQIVTALLHRQSSFIKNKVALSIIKDSELRMQSIALIHQRLYQTDDMVFIDIHTYIDDLVGHFRDSYGLEGNIQFTMDLEPLKLSVARAVSIGLIINESITNAIKYAYPSVSGTIFISLNTEGSQHNLSIKDNGIGLPEGWELAKVNSMGMNLIKGLSKQLDGTLNFIVDNGVTMQLIFRD